jgi:hypothetical protein
MLVFMPTFFLLSVCCSGSDNTGSGGITRYRPFPRFVDAVYDYAYSSRLSLQAACRKYIIYNIKMGGGGAYATMQNKITKGYIPGYIIMLMAPPPKSLPS